MAQSALKAIFRFVLRYLYRPFVGPPFPIGFQRRFVTLGARSAAPPPAEAEAERMTAFEVPTKRVAVGRDNPANRPAILWIHGGGFVLGSPESHGGLGGHLAMEAGADVYLPDYRLAPEHPFPAATDDAFSTYRDMLARGHDPSRVAIGGDSAGGAIAILTTTAIREMDVPSPAALVLISPVTDLTLSGPSIASKERVERLLRREWLEYGYRSFAGSLPLSDPRVSPLYEDVHGLPPTLIQVGEDEILLDDSLRFADRAWGSGVEVELQRFPRMWHDFQIHASLIEDSARAVGDIGGFLRRRWDGETAVEAGKVGETEEADEAKGRSGGGGAERGGG